MGLGLGFGNGGGTAWMMMGLDECVERRRGCLCFDDPLESLELFLFPLHAPHGFLQPSHLLLELFKSLWGRHIPSRGEPGVRVGVRIGVVVGVGDGQR